MRTPTIRADQVRSELIPLRGGLNESANFNYTRPGNLIACLNYESLVGFFPGYRSIAGYEAFDGRTAPSSVLAPRVDGVYDDADREAARTAITAVPGDGNVKGGFELAGEIYAVREDLVAEYSKVYKATSLGWVEVGQTLGEEIENGGKLKVIIYRFSGYNNPVAILIDGVSTPRVFNGTTFTLINHANLPTTIAPHIVGAYDNRLFLAYDTSIFFGAVGDPTDFGTLANAGEILLGERITNITDAPGNSLVITTESFIDILKSVGYDQDSWIFQKETFSKTVGAYEDTAVTMLGDVYFANKDGVLSLKTVDAFGDFSLNLITKDANKTYQARKGLILKGIADREKGQYRLFYDDGYVLSFSFDAEKNVRDIMVANYKLQLLGLFMTYAGDRKFMFTSNFVYELDKGTSFNGNEIPTTLQTSYYHYKLPAVIKKFRGFVIDLEGEIGTQYYFRGDFAYGDKYYGKGQSIVREWEVTGRAAWGDVNWGEFVWGSGGVDSKMMYMQGIGTSLSIGLFTKNKYSKQHTIQSLLVNYSIGKRRH